MKQTKGWLMSEGNKYAYVQVGRRICRLHVEYLIESTKDLAEFLKSPEGKDMLIAVSPNRVNDDSDDEGEL